MDLPVPASFPRHKFSEEVKEELVEFGRVSEEQKNNGSDLKSHEVWSDVFPKDCETSSESHESTTPEAVEVKATPRVLQRTLLPPYNSIFLEDLGGLIKKLIRRDDPDLHFLEQALLLLPEWEVDNVSKDLNGDLNTEQVHDYGVALQTIDNKKLEKLLPVFCQHILVPTLKKEFSEEISTLLAELTTSHSDLLQDECCSSLQGSSSDELEVLLQYLKKQDSGFNAALLRRYILPLEKLDENSLLIVQTLLNNDLEYDALSKFVDMLSTVAEDHTSDKNFGKLLMNVVEALGTNLTQLEQPLKHIIAGHKSVWKAKLEKTFATPYEDSMMFTQSFKEYCVIN